MDCVHELLQQLGKGKGRRAMQASNAASARQRGVDMAVGRSIWWGWPGWMRLCAGACLDVPVPRRSFGCACVQTLVWRCLSADAYL